MRKILSDLKRIEEMDNSNMYGLLMAFPKAVEDAYAIGSHFKLPAGYKRRYNAIAFSGLGGSAIGADFIKSYLEEKVATPIIVNRDYTLPALVTKDTLFIASSYSGNTEETLSAYKIAKKIGCNIIALSSGGELMNSALKAGFPFIRIPGKLPPRCAFAYGTIPSLTLFSDLGLISSQAKEVGEVKDILTQLRDRLKAEVPRRKNTAKQIALNLKDKFPVIYGASSHVNAVVTRWRGQLAENSKTLASSHLFPEMNHNEIVGWQNPEKLIKRFIVLMLRDKEDHPRVTKRMDITESILRKMKVDVIDVESAGKGLLSRLFSLVYIGDWVSFYLAILNGVDPTPVDRVTFLKKKLSE